MPPPFRPAAGIVLAGGAGRRLGGVDKPALLIGGSPLLDRALAALGEIPVVVVGPVRPTARAVIWVREDPVGGGPAAALAAGLAALVQPPAAVGPAVTPDAMIAVLAADLPAVTTATVQKLGAALGAASADGAVLVDDGGRQQLLLGVWRHDALVRACGVQADWTGVALRRLLSPLTRIGVDAAGDEAADIDTSDDLDRWRRGRPADDG